MRRDKKTIDVDLSSDKESETKTNDSSKYKNDDNDGDKNQQSTKVNASRSSNDVNGSKKNVSSDTKNESAKILTKTELAKKNNILIADKDASVHSINQEEMKSILKLSKNKKVEMEYDISKKANGNEKIENGCYVRVPADNEGHENVEGDGITYGEHQSKLNVNIEKKEEIILNDSNLSTQNASCSSIIEQGNQYLLNLANQIEKKSKNEAVEDVKAITPLLDKNIVEETVIIDDKGTIITNKEYGSFVVRENQEESDLNKINAEGMCIVSIEPCDDENVLTETPIKVETGNESEEKPNELEKEEADIVEQINASIILPPNLNTTSDEARTVEDDGKLSCKEKEDVIGDELSSNNLLGSSSSKETESDNSIDITMAENDTGELYNALHQNTSSNSIDKQPNVLPNSSPIDNRTEVKTVAEVSHEPIVDSNSAHNSKGKIKVTDSKGNVISTTSILSQITGEYKKGDKNKRDSKAQVTSEKIKEDVKNQEKAVSDDNFSFSSMSSISTLSSMSSDTQFPTKPAEPYTKNKRSSVGVVDKDEVDNKPNDKLENECIVATKETKKTELQLNKDESVVCPKSLGSTDFICKEKAKLDKVDKKMKEEIDIQPVSPIQQPTFVKKDEGAEFVEKLQDGRWEKIYTTETKKKVIINPLELSDKEKRDFDLNKDLKDHHDKKDNEHPKKKRSKKSKKSHKKRKKIHKQKKISAERAKKEAITKDKTVGGGLLGKTKNPGVQVETLAPPTVKKIPRWEDAAAELNLNILPLPKDTFIYYLRKYNLVLNEGFVGKRRFFFSCFFHERYFVLTKDKKLIYFRDPYIKAEVNHEKCLIESNCSCKRQLSQHSMNNLSQTTSDQSLHKSKESKSSLNSAKPTKSNADINNKKNDTEANETCECNNAKISKDYIKSGLSTEDKDKVGDTATCKCCKTAPKVIKKQYKLNEDRSMSVLVNEDDFKEKTPPKEVDENKSRHDSIRAHHSSKWSFPSFSSIALDNTVPNTITIKNILHRTDELTALYKNCWHKARFLRLDENIIMQRIYLHGASYPFRLILRHGDFDDELAFMTEGHRDHWTERLNYLLGRDKYEGCESEDESDMATVVSAMSGLTAEGFENFRKKGMAKSKRKLQLEKEKSRKK